MDEPTNDFDSVQWKREDEQADASPQTPSTRKSNGKRRQDDSVQEQVPDRNADETDLAGIGKEGFLECTVDKPQKENDGTKDAYVSYLITTHSDFKTFARPDFTIRRRFTDFLFLFKFLSKTYHHVAVPPIPDKHSMAYVRGDRFGPDFTQRRAHSLNRFIRRIALHPVLRRNTTFLTFLETSDWNTTMRGRDQRGSSFSDTGISGGQMLSSSAGSPNSSASAFDSFQDWGINIFSKTHKPDQRFIDVRTKSDKLDDDLGHVEKIAARVARRETELESDYSDLATQFRKLVHMEPAIGNDLTSFASSVETTAQGFKDLRDATDQDYIGSLRDMSAYVGAVKGLLKARDQKQQDFEGLTEYLAREANRRDTLASQHGSASLASGPTNFIRSKIEDVRGVDHEQSRRGRLRKAEMEIEKLTREVEEAKKISEAFDEQVVNETAEFERIKSYEFRDTLGSFAEAECGFWRGTIETWEAFLKGMEKADNAAKRMVEEQTRAS